uniref:phosphoribosylglycinamide formyltransferase, chloroplastic isoform X2 n=1 Tax=Erigeron canadensis TaxID=72917 RepID=UPI001CB939C6|nr:phosphoribosylglycinamide formyltransferase, chloroplastic isoform X2 [Erigeron canadensis]
METLFNITSNSLFSLLKTHKDSTFLPFSLLSSKSNNRVSFKIQDFQTFVAPRKRILKCISSDERMVKTSDEKAGLKKKNLAVFVSGGGSNFRAVHQAILSGDVHGQFVVLVTNKHDCGGAQYAREKGIPVIVYPGKKGEPQALSSDDLVAALSQYEIDFILLAGYLKLIPSELIQAYPKSILNIHPSLLPAFGGKGYYGTKVHKAVIASGARYSGPTIHFVDENYDTGRILAQRVVPVLANDTAEELAARVLRQR